MISFVNLGKDKSEGILFYTRIYWEIGNLVKKCYDGTELEASDFFEIDQI